MKHAMLIISTLIFSIGAEMAVIKEKPAAQVLEVESADDETCSTTASWMDLPTNFFQKAVDSMFSSRDLKDVESKFLFFSNKTGQEPQHVTNANFTSWHMDGFDPKIKIIFIVHGFKDRDAPWTKKLKDVLLLHEKCNVFIVESGDPSDTYSYVSKNIPKVGKQVALFVRKLKKSKGIELRNVHIIGHSAGAQSAGMAGKEIKNAEGEPVGRITGLDPAGPDFYEAPPEKRLDATDASFVDVIHTNRGCNRLEGFGYSGAIGHFDFYPNGGQIQPGCATMPQFFSKMNYTLAQTSFNYLFGTLDQNGMKKVNDILCSHTRSYDLFTSSISTKDCKLLAVQCSSWKRYLSGQCDKNSQVAMGYYANRYKDEAQDGNQKKFYLHTTANPPYCCCS